MKDISKITKFILSSCNIHINNIDIMKLEDNNSYCGDLFQQMNWDDLSKFIFKALNYKEYAPIIINNLDYILTHTNEEILNKLIIYLKINGFNDHDILQSIISNSNSLDIYLRQLRYAKNKIEEYKNVFEKENPIFYSLYDKLNLNIYNKCAFETFIIYPQSYFNVNEYLEYAFSKLSLNVNDFEYLNNGKGNYGWSFKNNDLVLKLSTSCAVWDIPIHYRINDFIIRKQFGKSLLTITPYGDCDSVTNMDIQDVLNDFEKSGIVLTDKNYKDNFAVVDYEIPKTMFRDVDGIRCYVDSQESKEYQKKKVKLIDQDFLYLKSDDNKKQGILGEKWKDE